MRLAIVAVIALVLVGCVRTWDGPSSVTVRSGVVLACEGLGFSARGVECHTQHGGMIVGWGEVAGFRAGAAR